MLVGFFYKCLRVIVGWAGSLQELPSKTDYVGLQEEILMTVKAGANGCSNTKIVLYQILVRLLFFLTS